jgi:stage II sporulation protein D
MLKKQPMVLGLFAALLLCGCVAVMRAPDSSPDTPSYSPPESGVSIRVLVLKGQRTVEIEGAKGPYPETRITAPRGGGLARVNGELKRLPLSFTPAREFIRVNGRPYRGTIEVFAGERALMVVDELDIEAYVAGLINYEISAKWPLHVVKAQAVIARTYALYQKKGAGLNPYHVEGSVLGQVYRGVNAEDAVAGSAVNETRGQVLTYNGDLALTVYHSNAGGRTDASIDVWSGDYSYLRSVQSPYDDASPGFSWEFTLSAATLKELLLGAGYDIGEPRSVRIRGFTPGGRARKVEIRDRRKRSVLLGANVFRKTIGYGAIKSTKFKVEKTGDLFRFEGRGSGHGVGLSQWGAKGMAENGYTYQEILRHYYPGTKLETAH